jgi:diguanylate cyclase (GGDEF)-like protein
LYLISLSKRGARNTAEIEVGVVLTAPFCIKPEVSSMKLLESEKKRRKEIYEYLTTTHMFCILVMMFALALGQGLFDLKNYGKSYLSFLAFCGASFIIFELIIIYNSKNASLDPGENISLIDLLYTGFPLAIAAVTLFVVRNIAFYIEVILLLPVIITSSVMGKKAGLMIAAVGTVLIYLKNILTGTSTDFFLILEANVILITVMFIVAWFIGAQTDFDNQYRLHLTKLATTDLLTGLYNYGYFQEKVTEYILNASERNPLGLIMVDIDYFKHYNDIHGHQAGDLLISEIGDILNTKASDTGFVSRYGGDEFVIVLPGADSKGAKQLAEDICSTIRNEDYPGEEFQPEGRITVSCGIAVCPTHARNVKDLIKYADQALYRAKNKDKNKVEMYFSVFDNLDVEGDEKELLNSIRTLVSVINAKDRYTYGHSERVTNHAIRLAERLDMPQEAIHFLGYAAFLHDIGKIEIDWEILNKVDPLNKKEWEIIKRHPEWGSDIVKAVEKLHPIVPVILHHHENYDGTGYPAGLKGEDIPILARIIRIADSYDAMISHRPYKKRLDASAALEEIKSNSGTQFDPELAAVFLEIIQEDIEAEEQRANCS